MRAQTERWNRTKELFEAAADLDSQDRARLLDRECEGDMALRLEVESLLESDEHTDGFIEESPLPLPIGLFADGKDDPLTNRQLGAYRIVRQIGRGGLGAVYLAARSDDQYRKEVAIKLVRRGLDTEDILQRFRNERQILAQLDHPNIARLIDGGTTEDGLPYFVMEHVAGEPIDEYCDKADLGATGRLHLFRKVCAAVTYAHQNLVIHRDIKPSNILVTKDGEAKLLDFGIAKLLAPGDELYTQTLPGLRVLTPDYASPEQIKGENVTTATDVYSLGVLLYELLTGQRPYRLTTRSADDIARAISEQHPEKPSTAVERSDLRSNASAFRNPKLLRGDLDNIVLMAMRKEPARRYPSVGQFSDDIRRHLEGLPVLARRDTWSYRSTKFVRRHKLGVFAAAAVVVTLIGGIIATFWQAQRATDQARLASQQRDRAERRFSDVRHLSNALLFEIAPKLERLEGSLAAREALVSRALEYLDSLAKESLRDGQLQGELAAAYEKVAELQGAPRKPNLSDFSGAIASYNKARRIRDQLATKDPADTDNLQRLASNLAATSYVRWWTSDISGSIADSQSALELFAKLRLRDPESVDLRIAMAEAEIDLASVHYFNDQLAEAYPPLQRALDSLEQLRQSQPGNTDVLRLIGRARTNLGVTLSWDNKGSESEAEMAQALAINERLVTEHPQDSVFRQGLLHTYLQASQLYQNSDPARSLAILVKAEQMAKQGVLADAADVQARQTLAKTYSMMGLIAINMKQLDEAVSYLKQSSDAFDELQTIDPRNSTYRHDIGRVLMFLGQTQYQKGDTDQAIMNYDKAAALFQADLTADQKNIFALRKIAAVYSYLADAHRAVAAKGTDDERISKRSAAREYHRKALDTFLRLESLGALTEKDRQYLEEQRAAVTNDQNDTLNPP